MRKIDRESMLKSSSKRIAAALSVFEVSTRSLVKISSAAPSLSDNESPDRSVAFTDALNQQSSSDLEGSSSKNLKSGVSASGGALASAGALSFLKKGTAGFFSTKS